MNFLICKSLCIKASKCKFVKKDLVDFQMLFYCVSMQFVIIVDDESKKNTKCTVTYNLI